MISKNSLNSSKVALIISRLSNRTSHFSGRCQHSRSFGTYRTGIPIWTWFTKSLSIDEKTPRSHSNLHPLIIIMRHKSNTKTIDLSSEKRSDLEKSFRVNEYTTEGNVLRIFIFKWSSSSIGNCDWQNSSHSSLQSNRRGWTNCNPVVCLVNSNLFRKIVPWFHPFETISRRHFEHY